MFVSIQAHDAQPGSPLKDHLERRLRAAARSFGSRVSGVALRATSTAPAGRTSCRVVLSLDSGVYVGTARGPNVYFAAEEAIARAERAAARAVREERSASLGLLGLTAILGERGAA
jgi:ribosome-associated translation inhibitor RaiA